MAPAPRIRDGDLHDRRNFCPPGLPRWWWSHHQWSDAMDDRGGGILHIETPPEELVISGGLFHGIQLRVNLPAKSKMIPPAYQNLEAEEVTLLSSADGGSLVRVIAGELGEHRGPGSTHTPMALMHATIFPGALLELPWNAGFNALVYVLTGSGRSLDGGRRVHSGQLVAFGPGDWVAVRNHDPQNASGVNLEILVLGGQPIREPVEHYGPFVMNTRDEIRQALEDFEAGRLGRFPRTRSCRTYRTLTQSEPNTQGSDAGAPVLPSPP